MNVNLEWYRVFYQVAKTGSLTRAAALLHITQPAVSHTLKQMEEQLGGSLFFRTSRGVQLTTEGKVLLGYIEQAFINVNMGEKAIAEMHNLDKGEIHIGASDTLCKYFLLPYLDRYRAEYPNIRIHVTNRTTPETIQLLKDGRIDFGIVSLPVTDRQVEVKESSAIQDCLVGGKGYSHLGNTIFTGEELGQYPILMLEKGASTRKYIDDYAVAHDMQIIPEIELGSIDLLVQFALRDFGLAFVIRDYVMNELREGSLVEIPLAAPIPKRHVGVATLRGVPLSAASSSFLSLLPDQRYNGIT
ncbi:LysR family transcriptional regulator [Paenibacillus urinalis]|uniref:LysR family transcriptional regulator n=1 Tax=Paenibacillus urinalis TaxID=521520 RepID=A0AAX3MVP9_9BACL|nr:MULTISPECIES: LysR family transcriptional regulator [Paenibacillus]WDH81681.1 LysR family transcriptional regulator [Paenibacillus urinalis]WDH97726.1 LysR family transcriptional regulator [Paenibacillus urinalis]WDI01401.1 LysR family transcriptional regulator [Paenibacillus urinalis]GAK42184.1 LysR family transcriptional regulator [Paenibacillus sp. TCA20]